jgi:hypothetical protein
VEIVTDPKSERPLKLTDPEPWFKHRHSSDCDRTGYDRHSVADPDPGSGAF